MFKRQAELKLVNLAKYLKMSSRRNSWIIEDSLHHWSLAIVGESKIILLYILKKTKLVARTMKVYILQNVKRENSLIGIIYTNLGEVECRRASSIVKKRRQILILFVNWLAAIFFLVLPKTGTNVQQFSVLVWRIKVVVTIVEVTFIFMEVWRTRRCVRDHR